MPTFTWSACRQFDRVRIKKLKVARDSWYIFKNELGKSCFHHDMAYGDFKDLPKRTAADKVLHDKAYRKMQNMANINVELF